MAAILLKTLERTKRSAWVCPFYLRPLLALALAGLLAGGGVFWLLGLLTLLANGRSEFDIAEDKLEEAVKCYSLHLGPEEIHRRTSLSRLSTVTLENIFDMTYVHTISRAKHDQPLL